MTDDGKPAFEALPRPRTRSGPPRRVGVELEFGGLDVTAAARVVQDRLGGRFEGPALEAEADPRAEPSECRISDTALGRVRILLDTAMKPEHGTLERLGLSLARPVIPVEIVLEPVSIETLPTVERLAADLAAEGARGTGAEMLYAFGLHLNVEAQAVALDALLPVMRAYAFIEDWLRAADPIDTGRALLPFVAPYPRAYLDLLAEDPPHSMDALVRGYLAHNAARNRALDMLPALAMHDAAAVRAALGPDAKVSPRPAFHYRLPDCRIDEPGWTLAREWNKWVLIERVAEDAALLDSLALAWSAHRDKWRTMRGDWRYDVDELLSEAGLVGSRIA